MKITNDIELGLVITYLVGPACIDKLQKYYQEVAKAAQDSVIHSSYILVHNDDFWISNYATDSLVYPRRELLGRSWIRNNGGLRPSQAGRRIVRDSLQEGVSEVKSILCQLS